jgi:Restriction endonuclease NotI
MPFVPTAPFAPTDFPDAEKPFPIVEVFGYDRRLLTREAQNAFRERECPFGGIKCEKFRQYKYGYCSVVYKADGNDRPHVYAVCDHRLDGDPLQEVVRDAFDRSVHGRIALVGEVVFTSPRISFDYIAIDPVTNHFVGIETQAIDIRGGGVGPAWRAILEGDPASWRERYTDEAGEKDRGDTIAYGVNTANIYKRLGLQVAEKGALFKSWGSKLYVVCQHAPYEYLRSRIKVTWTDSNDSSAWDIAFVSFDYTGKVLPSGQLEMGHVGTFRTTVEAYAAALTSSTSLITKRDFLRKVREKGKL